METNGVNVDNVDDPKTEVDVNSQDNTKDPGYMAAVKADLREKYGDELRNYQNINPIIEDYFSLKEKVKEGYVPLPKEGATEEEVAEYRQKMGIPDKAEAYELPDLPEGVDRQEEFDSWFKEAAVKTGLTKEQAKGMYSEYNQLRKMAYDKTVEMYTNTERELKKEYGDGYEEAKANMVKILEMGGEDFVEWLDDTGVGNDPRAFKLFAKLGHLISEDSIGQTKPRGGDGSTLSLAERLYPSKKE